MDHPNGSPATTRTENDEVAILVDRNPELDSISGAKEELKEEAAELLEDLNAFYSRSPAIQERALELASGGLNRQNSSAYSRSPSLLGTEALSSGEALHTKSENSALNGGSSQPLLAEQHRDELLALAARYERLLHALGHEKEAQHVAEFRQEFERADERPGGDQDDGDLLSGMEALLKDGIVRFLITVKPFLPSHPMQIVKFRDVTYSGLLPVDDTAYDDLATKFLPFLRKKVPKKRVAVLSGASGYLMPGSLTLCLGPLASGQTALTKILAGRAWVDKKMWHQAGHVTYNGTGLHEVEISRLASYAGPHPCHHPALTVRETVEFARDCSQAFKPWHNEDLKEVLGLPKDAKYRADAKTDLIIKVLGLKQVEHVPVAALTPDELRRLSVAEMRAGMYTVHLHDDAGIDLDPALAFDIVSMLKATTRVFQTIQWVAADHISTEVYNQFDRIIILNGGRMVYQGPRLDALTHFERLGYVKPQHVEVADYLMEVTTRDGAAYLQPGAQPLTLDEFVTEYEKSELHQDVLRIAASESTTHVFWVKLTDPGCIKFEDVESAAVSDKVHKLLPAISWLDETHFKKRSLDRTSDPQVGDVVTGVRTGDEMFRYLAVGDHDASAAALAVALKGAKGDTWLQLERPLSKVEGVLKQQWDQKYVQPFWPSTWRLIRRQWTVTIRNSAAIKARLIQVIILGIFAGTLLYQKPLRPPTTILLGLRKAAPFIAIMVIFLGALAQVPGQMVERAIYYKHHAQGFYRASSYVLAAFVCNAPLVAMEVLVYGCLLYFLTGASLAHGAAPLFIFLALLYMTGTISSSMIRMLTSCMSSAAAVNAIAGILIGLFITFAGFVIPLHVIPNWWFWFYYLDPMQWIITGLMVNEFRSSRYDQICGDLPQATLAVLPYCRGENLGKSVGAAYLNFYSIQYRKWWLGVCFAVLVVFVLGFQVGAWLGLKHISFPEALTMRISLGNFLQTRRVGKSQDKESSKARAPEWIPLHPKQAERSSVNNEQGDGHVAQLVGLPPFQPVTLSWHDVSSEVPIPGFKDPRVVLSHVSGWAKPGTMTAVMGVKTSGKTVLMDILAGRRTPGRTKGSILVNGYPRDVPTFRRVRGHVTHTDVHPVYATVRECVLFSAKLRLPQETTPGMRDALFNEALTLTSLSDVQHHLVGLPGESGLDPEQLRRLSLAVELVTNPSVIFADEPDKNLDPQAARRIVACIQAVAESGRTVISTLEHPVGRILGVFDRLLLLKRGGETTYWGPVGGRATRCRDVINYFESIPGTPPCGFNENPAAYLIECIGGGLRQRTDRDYSFDYRHSVLAAANAQELRVLRRSKGQAGPRLTESGYAAPMGTIYWEVFLRVQRTYFRNLSYSFGRIVSAVLLGLIFGTVFWQMPYTTIIRSGARGGVIYISTLLMTIGNATAVILELNKERPVYDRERSHRMYPALAWHLAWGVAEIPYIAVSFLFHCAILCSMTNIATDSAASFFEFWFTLCLFAASIMYAAMFLAVATPAPQIAIVIINVFINMMIASAGYVIPKQQIPKFWQFAYWINPAQYALNSLRSIAFYCNTKSAECTLPGCATNPAACPACTCPRLKDNFNVFVWTSQESSARLDNGRRLYDWLALLGFCVFFRVMAYYALRRAKFNNKY